MIFAVVLWVSFAIGLTCARSGRWYVVLAAGIALSIGSFVAVMGYLGGIAVFLLLARPRRIVA